MLLHDFMEFFAREYPTKPCIEMGETLYSYQRANARANQMAHAFVATGMAKGDRLAWLSKNCIEQFLLFYAGSKVGVVPTPLNYRLAPREWAYIINDCEAKVLVCEAELCASLDTVRESLQHVEHFICIDGNPEGWQSFANWVDGRSDDNPQHAITPDDDLYQMYTSGTTGLPKGAVLSQAAITSNTRALTLAGDFDVFNTRIVLALPMYHAAASISHMGTVSVGGSLVLHREFNPVKVVDDLEQKKATNCTLVPSMIQACLVHVPNIGQRDFSALRVMAYGASPIAAETLRSAMEVFGCKFAQVFGMTETTAVATQLDHHAHLRAINGEPHLLTSCGRAAAGTYIKIVDEEHREVARGMVGEIAVKGPQLMKRYWNLPEATAKTLQDGWLYTGDAAIMDEEGFVFIQDRIKDMIVSGGENIYPKEVENALFDHPNVADAAVIGIPSEKFGEALLAFIVTRNGLPIDSQEIMDFCRERLAGYKIPRQYEFITEVPRNPSGKVLKKDLREPYWRGIDRRVG